MLIAQLVLAMWGKWGAIWLYSTDYVMLFKNKKLTISAQRNPVYDNMAKEEILILS